MSRLRPIIHGRDHEHGGADPTRIVWESDGTGDGGDGGGGGPTLQGRYQSTLAGVAAGAIATASWAYVDGDELLDLTDPSAPTVAAPGLYAVQVTITWSTE